MKSILYIKTLKLNKRAAKNKYFAYIIVFLLASVYITFPLLLDDQILKMNDLSGNSVNLIYIKKTLLEFHVFPQWNHQLNYGIPLVADPLNTFFNPIIALAIILFPIQGAIKIIYFSSIFLSGVTLFLLLRKLNISRAIALFTSLTYMSSGFMTSRIYAGHLEKIITYPLYPLLLLSTLQVIQRGSVKWVGITAFILSLFIWSGGIYEFMYAFITFGLAVLFYTIRSVFIGDKVYTSHIKNSMLVILFTFLFSAFKIFPILEIKSYFSHIRDPFLGSQNILSLIYNFFIPYKNIFIFFNLENKVTQPYFWWEHYAYVGVLPLLCLLLLPFIFKYIKSKELGLFIFLFITFVSYSMLGSPLSPFHWLFKYSAFLEQFRIPSRIFIVLVPILLILSAFVLNYFYNLNSRFVKIIIILVLFFNFIDVSRVFHSKVGTNEFIYSPPISDLGYLLQKLEELDNEHYFIGQSEFFFKQIPVDAAVHNNQKFLPNYGFMLDKSFFLNRSSNSGIMPKYFIYPNGIQPSDINTYEEILTGSENSKVYKNKFYTHYADIYKGQVKELNRSSSNNGQIKSIEIKPDKVEIVVDSINEGNTLLVLESYAPGWKARIDDQSLKLLPNEFLNVPLKKGEHTYTFTYYNNKFILGVFITLCSLTLWILFVLKYENKNKIKSRKK